MSGQRHSVSTERLGRRSLSTSLEYLPRFSRRGISRATVHVYRYQSCRRTACLVVVEEQVFRQPPQQEWPDLLHPLPLHRHRASVRVFEPPFADPRQLLRRCFAARRYPCSLQATRTVNPKNTAASRPIMNLPIVSRSRCRNRHLTGFFMSIPPHVHFSQ